MTSHAINDEIKFPVLLDSAMYTAWNTSFGRHLSKFGQAGKAILAGKKDEPVYPLPEDMMKDADGNDTAFQMFEHDDADYDVLGHLITPMAFTGDGFKDYRKAVVDFPKVVAAYNVFNIPLSHFIVTHLGPDPTRAVYSDPQFLAAMNKPISDTFEMKRIIDKMYSKGTGRTVVRQLQNFLNCKQGDLSHEAYIEAIKAGAMTTAKNYESPGHPGFISVAALTCGIYLGGLDPAQFQFKLQSTYLNPIGSLTDFDALAADYQIYSREQANNTLPTQYSSALVASGTGGGPPRRLCVTCSAPLLPTPVNFHGRPFRFCGPCHRAQLSKGKDYAGKPGPIVKKATSAELLAARALIAANDAVSLPTGGISASTGSLSAPSASIANDSDSD